MTEHRCCVGVSVDSCFLVDVVAVGPLTGTCKLRWMAAQEQLAMLEHTDGMPCWGMLARICTRARCNISICIHWGPLC